MDSLRLGIDIGTDCISAAVLSHDLDLIDALPPMYHFGNPVQTLRECLGRIVERYGDRITQTAFTGNGGEWFARQLDVPFFHDTITIPAGAAMLSPGTRYIFHIGARDSYFFEMEAFHDDGVRRTFVPDHGTGTKCGGGSGLLIAKQCRRFFESMLPAETLPDEPSLRREFLDRRLNRLFDLAEDAVTASEKMIDVGGRCGVVIQSDMIHLQNTGESIPDILAGLYHRIIKNYRSDVLKTRDFDGNDPAVATGGVFQSPRLRRILTDMIGVSVTCPEAARSVGAIGAVIKAGADRRAFDPALLDRMVDAEKQAVPVMPPLRQALERVIIYPEATPDRPDDPLQVFDRAEDGPVDVILGVDGGSTTTKVVVARASDLTLLAQICLYTNGKPLAAIQDIFRRIETAFGDRLTIRAVAYTGSSGAFYHRLFTRHPNGSPVRTVDLVRDEITCHALGVRHFNARTDTIFELGGQDAKFTVFNADGTVKKSRMNLSCMAGTGQTMQNMVEMLGLDIRTTFHDMALSADCTPVVDDTCGVFTEAGIARLIALGFPKAEIAAAIAYGFMGGYVNKFIGQEIFGDCASAQGGPFLGRAPLAALSMHTGMTIHAFPHRQMFGALGAAIAARDAVTAMERENIPFECRFRGLALHRLSFEKQDTTCSRIIDDSCGLKDCRLSVYAAGDERIITGGACPKGNTDGLSKKAPDYVARYKAIVDRHLSQWTCDLNAPSPAERILVPRSLTFQNEKGVFYCALYRSLGFNVALSPESDDAVNEMGLRYAHSETCFPVKLAHGHAARLREHLRPGLDKMLLVNAIGQGKKRYKFCPYVAGAGFLTKEALDLPADDVLLPVLYFDDPANPLFKSVHADLQRVFGKRFRVREVKQALGRAGAAQKACLDEIYRTGQALVDDLRRKKTDIYIGLGRGYTLLDDKAGSRVHELFVKNGLHFIPSFFLKPAMHDIGHIAENMYWVQGRSIIRYTLETALHPDFFPVRATNFNCGSDSMLLFHEEHIMERARKPHLVLQTDGHSSNAQFGTRILANHEVVKTFRPAPVRIEDFITIHPKVVLKGKIIGIPYMGDHSHVLAATFTALGIDARVMPTQTPEAKALAAKAGGGAGNICRPFSFQVGDTLSWLNSLAREGLDPNTRAVVLEPMAKGPCRFGQYHVLLKKIFIENGFPGVDMLSPDADSDYANLPMTDGQIVSQARNLFRGIYCMDILYDALLRTRPYEKEKGSAQRCYRRLSNALLALVEKNAGVKTLLPFMNEAKNAYEALIDQTIRRKPIIAMTGEIFVRLNPHANQQSLMMLEKYGLETRLSPLSLWMDYANASSIDTFRLTRRWKHCAKAVLKKHYMRRTARALIEPFRDFLKGREAHDSGHIIDHIQQNLVYDKSIQGESPLSIGEAYMFAMGKLPDISGIFHVGPFGCMQETAATSQIQSIYRQKRSAALSIDEKIIPFMDAVFGDSELANLEAEIAVFSEKCHLKQRLSRGTPA
ncbi:acyl-CoA dehydratase activase [Desulfatiferula olefinivorans]